MQAAEKQMPVGRVYPIFTLLQLSPYYSEGLGVVVDKFAGPIAKVQRSLLGVMCPHGCGILLAQPG